MSDDWESKTVSKNGQFWRLITTLMLGIPTSQVPLLVYCWYRNLRLNDILVDINALCLAHAQAATASATSPGGGKPTTPHIHAYLHSYHSKRLISCGVICTDPMATSR